MQDDAVASDALAGMIDGAPLSVQSHHLLNGSERCRHVQQLGDLTFGHEERHPYRLLGLSPHILRAR
jgi:hypothetical protein